MTRKPMSKKVCKTCGEEYIPTGATQKYCNSTCNAKRYKVTTKGGKAKKVNPKFLTRGTIHYHGLLLDKEKR